MAWGADMRSVGRLLQITNPGRITGRRRMRYRTITTIVVTLAVLAVLRPSAPAGQAARPSAATQFVVLGTASGPNSEAARAQPANALIVAGQVYLVDAGDGAVAQLAKAGLRLGAVRGVFLSHL